MNAWSQPLQVTLPTVLALTAFLYGMHFGGESAPQPKRLRRRLGLLGLGLFLSLFVLRAVSIGDWPGRGPYSTLSWVALGALLLHVTTSGLDRRPGASAIVFGVVATMQLVASSFGPFDFEREGQPTIFDLLHVGTSVLASSALVLSGLHGALYLTAWRRMRQRSFGPLLRGLPSLEDLARLSRRSALVGFILLTVGINFGIGWAHIQGVEAFSYGDPWVLSMIVLWVYFGLIAFSGKIPGVTAMRASMAATLGLTFFFLASLATLIPSVSFHWGE